MHKIMAYVTANMSIVSLQEQKCLNGNRMTNNIKIPTICFAAGQ